MLKNLISKIVFFTGFITIAFAIYATSFYLIRDKVVLPFEHSKIHETHAIRPVYNILYYPMRYYSANGSSFSRDIPDTYRGHLEKNAIVKDEHKGHRSAGIKQFEGNFVSIGFVGPEHVLKAYDAFDDGAFVKLVFGRALSKDYDRFINKLIDVEVLELMDDPRIDDLDYSKVERKKIENAYKNLRNQATFCVNSFIDNYGKQVLLHCQQTGYAQNIGGGCYHILGYSLNTAVFEEAIKSCSK